MSQKSMQFVTEDQKMLRSCKYFWLFVLVVACLSSFVAKAGNPIVISSTGRPVNWDTSKPISYVVDSGSFGRLTYDQSLKIVQLAMSIWESVEGTGIVFNYVGPTGFDVTADTPHESLNGFYEDGYLVIVFDNDGRLTSTSGTTLGVASSISDGGPHFLHAVLTMNNLILDGDETVEDVSLIDALGVMAHELGHVLGLGHSLLNFNGFFSNPQYLPTMYPYSLLGSGQHQVNLHPDDIATLRWLYGGDVALLNGTVFDAANKPLYSMAVTARSTDSPFCQSYQQVTGVACLNEDGLFNFDCQNPAEEGMFWLPVMSEGDHTIEVAQMPNFGRSNPKYRYTIKPPLEIPGNPEFYNHDDQAFENPLLYDLIAVDDSVSGLDVVLSDSSEWQFFDLGYFDDDINFILPSDDPNCPAHPQLDVATLIGATDTKDTTQNGKSDISPEETAASGGNDEEQTDVTSASENDEDGNQSESSGSDFNTANGSAGGCAFVPQGISNKNMTLVEFLSLFCLVLLWCRREISK